MTELYRPERTASPGKRAFADTRRRSAILTGSVAAHAAVFTVLGLGWLDEDTEPTPVPPYRPIYIDNEPWPLVSGSLRKPADPVLSLETTPAGDTRRLIAPAKPTLGSIPRTGAGDDATVSSSAPQAPAAAPVPGNAPWAVVREGREAVVGRALRGGALGCRAGFADQELQARCDQSFGLAAARAAPILGTDNPARDARFAAEGQAELDAYENLRAPLKPPQPCAGADMMGRCPAIFTIPLFGKKF